MKIVVIGDLHGRNSWIKIVAENPDADRFIFLGDLVTSYEDITIKEQVDNVSALMELSEQDKRCILLYGNHDLQMMGYAWSYCSGWSHKLFEKLSNIGFYNWMLNTAKVAYLEDNILFTHAGVTKTWLDDQKLDIDGLLRMGPDIKLAYSDYGSFNSRVCLHDPTGDNIWQSPIWVRPMSLANDHIEGYTQVVGHTPVKAITNIKDVKSECSDNIWLCDNLPNEYLVINDNEFNVVKL